MEDLFAQAVETSRTFELYGRLRDDHPVYFSQKLHGYVLTRFADIHAALNDPATFSSAAPLDSLSAMANFNEKYAPLYTDQGLPAPLPTLVVTDGAVHDRYRKSVEAAFGSGAVKRLEPRIVKITDELLDRFIDVGKVDLYARFCLKLPLYIILELLGLPTGEANEQLMKQAAHSQGRLAGGMETEESRVALHREHMHLYRLVKPFVDRYRAVPEDNLLSDIIHSVPEDGVPYDDREILALVSLFNVGGNETTTNGLGNMFQWCIQTPGKEHELREHRELVPKFVEETLRLECPVPVMPRWAKKDIELHGTKIPAGSLVYIAFVAASRDERQFECPAEMRMGRRGIRNHAAFGMGPHYCLGSILARAELAAAMNRVLDRMENIRFDPEGPPLRRSTRVIDRGPTTLPILFDKR